IRNFIHNNLPHLIETDGRTLEKKENHYIFLIQNDNKKYEIVESILEMLLSKNIQKTIDLKFSMIFFDSQCHILTKTGFITINDYSELPLFDYNLCFFSRKDLFSDTTDEKLASYLKSANALVEEDLNLINHINNVMNFLKISYHVDLLGVLSVVKRLLGKEGGSTLCFLSDAPNSGIGNLQEIESKEKDTLKIKDPQYTKMAEKLSINHISVTLFLIPTKHIDVRTLAVLARVTGGSVHYITNRTCNIQKDDIENNTSRAFLVNEQLKDSLLPILRTHLNPDCQNVSFMRNALIKLRINKNVTYDSFYGTFHLRSDNIIGMAIANSQESFSVAYNLINEGKEEKNLNKIINICQYLQQIRDYPVEKELDLSNLSINQLKDNDKQKILQYDQMTNLFYGCFTDFCIYQLSMIYTNIEGNRMIRVSNWALPIANSFDRIAIDRFITKFSIPISENKNEQENSKIVNVERILRDPVPFSCLFLHKQLNEMVFDIQNGEKTIKAEIKQLLGKEPLKGVKRHNTFNLQNRSHLQPVHQTASSNVDSLLELLVSPLIREKISLDYRSYYLHLCLHKNQTLERVIHPYLYEIVNTDDNYEQESNPWQIPLPLSVESLSLTGVYFLDCGTNVFLFVAQEAGLPGLGQIFKEIVLNQENYFKSDKNITTDFEKRLNIILSDFEKRLNILLSDFEKRLNILLSDIKKRNSTVHVNFYMIDDTITEEDLGGQDEWRKLFFSYFWRDNREQMLQQILDENKK
ncbi:Vesicle coat complex COPII, subunit SEC24/subunit SFB2, partial [Pseudoloma neurophilia]